MILIATASQEEEPRTISWHTAGNATEQDTVQAWEPEMTICISNAVHFAQNSTQKL